MAVLAVIPARGGSKGIPRKNVRLLAGKPLIAHAIEAARGSRSIDRVVVSTDDTEIGRVAERFGAEVVWRPTEISGDTASSEAALLFTLDFLESKEGYRPDILVFLQCTAPLTLAEDIDDTVAKLRESGADSAFSVTPCHRFLWRNDESGAALGVNHDKSVRPRRQERTQEFEENGAVYALKVNGFKQCKHRFFGKTAMQVMPAERSIDLDTLLDFRLAEVLLEERRQQLLRQALPSRVAGVVLDFDGVFTDNQLVIWEDGREGVICSRSDGWGLAQLRDKGIPLVVISTETNPVVSARCRKLDIACIQGAKEKLSLLKEWALQRGLDLADILYVGNDVNDLSCLQAVGYPVAVADAHPSVLSAAKIVLSSPGGKGALRELSELILEGWEEKND
jgi:N-acylneuraminate cytidylyltransferase